MDCSLLDHLVARTGTSRSGMPLAAQQHGVAAQNRRAKKRSGRCAEPLTGRASHRGCRVQPPRRFRPGGPTPHWLCTEHWRAAYRNAAPEKRGGIGSCGFGRVGLLPIYWREHSSRGFQGCGAFCGRDERDSVWFWPIRAYSQCGGLQTARPVRLSGPTFQLGCNQPRRTYSGCMAAANHGRVSRKAGKTWTMRDAAGFFQEETP